MRFEDIIFVYQLREKRLAAWHGRLHRHRAFRYELHYFISGEGRFRDKGAVFTIDPGRLYVTPPGSSHQVLASSQRRPLTYYAVLVDTSDDEEARILLDSLSAPLGSYPIGAAHRFFFADLVEKGRSPRPELEKAAHHALLSFLYALGGGASAPRSAADNVHVEKALAIMQSSIEGCLGLGEICDRIKLSREHFVRLFSERMGMPPMRYYSRLKIEAAQAMLSSTNLRVLEIADKLGFENQFNFTRAFKRVSGLAPTEYRATCLQRADFAADRAGA
jgi:AraC-like DNA-binding protein/mannose-6-phosphate isomerase-like protein (cupin superfamily)